MTYREFLENKIDIAPQSGIEVDPAEISPATSVFASCGRCAVDGAAFLPGSAWARPSCSWNGAASCKSTSAVRR